MSLFIISLYLLFTTTQCSPFWLYCFTTAPVQVKELTFSSGIASHDLTTKLRQVESWLEKKHHVKITLRSGRGEPAVNLVRGGVPHSFLSSTEKLESYLNVC